MTAPIDKYSHKRPEEQSRDNSERTAQRAERSLHGDVHQARRTQGNAHITANDRTVGEGAAHELIHNKEDRDDRRYESMREISSYRGDRVGAIKEANKEIDRYNKQKGANIPHIELFDKDGKVVSDPKQKGDARFIRLQNKPEELFELGAMGKGKVKDDRKPESLKGGTAAAGADNGYKYTDIQRADGTSSYTVLNKQTNQVELTSTKENGQNGESIFTKTTPDFKNTWVTNKAGKIVSDKFDYPGGKYDLTEYQSDGTTKTTNFINENNYAERISDKDGKTTSGHIRESDPDTGDIKTTSLGRDPETGKELVTGEITEHRDADGKVTASGWLLDHEGKKIPLEPQPGDRANQTAQGAPAEVLKQEPVDQTQGANQRVERTQRADGYDEQVFNGRVLVGENHLTQDGDVTTETRDDYAFNRRIVEIHQSNGHRLTETDIETGAILYDNTVSKTPDGMESVTMRNNPERPTEKSTVTKQWNSQNQLTYSREDLAGGRYSSAQLDPQNNTLTLMNYKGDNDYTGRVIKSDNVDLRDIDTTLLNPNNSIDPKLVISGETRRTDKETGDIVQTRFGEQNKVIGQIIRSGPDGRVTGWTVDKDGNKNHIDTTPSTANPIGSEAHPIDVINPNDTMALK